MFKILILSLILISTASALTFTCLFRMRTIYSLLYYTCDEPKISGINESENLTEVYGNHMTGKSNSDVTFLWIYRPQNLTFFPKNIEKFFPNLVSIIFTYTDIVSFIGDEFRAFPELFYVTLSNNKKLERIPGNLFEFNPLINDTRFHDCNLKYIGEGLFDGLKKLKFLDVLFNDCVDGFADNYPTKMAKILETIRNNCTDIYSTTSTTTEAPSCSRDLNEIICNIQEQNRVLLQENVEIKKNLNEVRELIVELASRP